MFGSLSDSLVLLSLTWWSCESLYSHKGYILEAIVSTLCCGFELRSSYAAVAFLKSIHARDGLASASPGAEITGICHCAPFALLMFYVLPPEKTFKPVTLKPGTFLQERWAVK